MRYVKWCDYKRGFDNIEDCKNCPVKKRGGVSLENFEECLMERGYMQLNPTGIPGKVPCYVGAVSIFCFVNGISAEELAKDIQQVVKRVSSKKYFVRASIGYVNFINGMKAFEEYVKCKQIPLLPQDEAAPQNENPKEQAELKEKIKKEVSKRRRKGGGKKLPVDKMLSGSIDYGGETMFL